jgi:hypothetical protein
MKIEKLLEELGVPPVDLTTHPLAKVRISPAKMEAMMGRGRRIEKWLRDRQEARDLHGDRIDPELYNARIRVA